MSKSITVGVREELSLALRKTKFETNMKKCKLLHVMKKYMDSPGFLDTEAFQTMEYEYLEKIIQERKVYAGVADILLGQHIDGVIYEFMQNYRYIRFNLPDGYEALADSIPNENHAISNSRRFESFTDFIARAYPVSLEQQEEEHHLPTAKQTLSRTVTFQVTDACNLACTYCYQINKGTRKMKLETAKKFIDKLLSGEDGFSSYVNPTISPAIIIEFIGGEPFLEIDLIEQIVDYFKTRSIELNHPWAEKYCISICSNGVLYRDPKVQNFLQQNKDNISFSVTLDGNKELHDKCRIFPDGRPSYDIAKDATMDWMHRGNYMGSKITISPENLPYIGDALRHIVNLGYDEINANCIFEAEWTESDAGKLYHLMKEFADFLLSDEKYKDIDCSLFSAIIGKPKKEDDLQNWCGGTGSMLSMDPDGWLYPCIRYMESSLGTVQKPMRIGHVDYGIATCSEHKNCIDCLNSIDRKTQSTYECFHCPIAEGCAWCSAYNYQENGTADKRVTKICPMHKGRVLANVYYWNKYRTKYGVDKPFNLWVPEEWAVPIIGKEEYEMLKELVKERGGYINESEIIIKNYEPEGLGEEGVRG